jgi:hypothetical protein
MTPGQGLVGAAGAGGSGSAGASSLRPGVPGPEPRAGDANGRAGWSPSDSRAEALSWRASGGDATRRNHPAGGATPGQGLSSGAGSSASGWEAGPGGWALASGWRGPGTIRPGGTDQAGMRFSRSSQRNKPVRWRSSSRESSGEAPILRFPLDWLLSVSTTDPSPGTHFRQIPQRADPHTFWSKRDAPRLNVTD